MTETSLFDKPDIFEATRILVVQPHYDDNDIFAGGTLAKLAEQGVELVYLTVTDDLVGVIDQTLSEDEMAAWLKDNQAKAGEFIGVKEQYWLGYPDGGKYDYFDVRRDIMEKIRLTRPDFIMTCDPWVLYEMHNDHILTGKAVAEAANLFGMTRLETSPDVDEAYKQDPFDLKGIVFYTTDHPNTTVDITSVWDKKQQAVAQYTAQFSEESMEILQQRLELSAAHEARSADYTYAESIKVMYTWQLHGVANAWSV